MIVLTQLNEPHAAYRPQSGVAVTPESLNDMNKENGIMQ
jgi:hypothetical protein